MINREEKYYFSMCNPPYYDYEQEIKIEDSKRPTQSLFKSKMDMFYQELNEYKNANYIKKNQLNKNTYTKKNKYSKKNQEKN